MKTAKKLLIFVALTAGLTIPAYGAQYAHYARKAAIGASWLGAIGAYCMGTSWMLSDGLARLYNYKNSTYLTDEEAPDSIKKFVHEIMQRERLADPTTIKVSINSTNSTIKHDVYMYSNQHFRGICLAKETADSLTNSLNNTDKFTSCHNHATGRKYNPTHEENIDLIRAILTHEAAHIKHEHYGKKDCIAALTIPLALLFCSLTSPIFKIISRSRTSLIATGCLLHATNQLLYKKYCRLHELQADDAVYLPSEIAARAKYFRAISDDSPQGIPECLVHTYHALCSTHPSHEERAERYERRLQEYEENA